MTRAIWPERSKPGEKRHADGMGDSFVMAAGFQPTAELAGEGPTVNCAVPSLIDTIRAVAEEPGDPARLQPLVGGKGRADEVSAMVRHLCGLQSRYINGQIIHVKGAPTSPRPGKHPRAPDGFVDAARLRTVVWHINIK